MTATPLLSLLYNKKIRKYGNCVNIMDFVNVWFVKEKEIIDRD